MEFIDTPARKASRQENEARFIRAGIHRYAGLLHDELKRRVPRTDRIERYQAEIAKLKALNCVTAIL